MTAPVAAPSAPSAAPAASPSAPSTAPVAAPSAPSAAPAASPSLEAEPRRPAVHERREGLSFPRFPVAMGSNPVGWLRGFFGASLYVGVSRRHALRADFDFHGATVPLRMSVGADSTPFYSGYVKDYGISWVWYFRQRWQGFMLDVGALRRDRAVRSEYEDEVTKNWTTTYSGRAMIGRSWRFGPTFVAAAVGLSVGRETGLETVKYEWPGPPLPGSSRQLDRLHVDGEAYLRMGFVFDK